MMLLDVGEGEGKRLASSKGVGRAAGGVGGVVVEWQVEFELGKRKVELQERKVGGAGGVAARVERGQMEMNERQTELEERPLELEDDQYMDKHDDRKGEDESG